VPYTQLASSGTAALTTAMAALGLGAGDEIIMPTFTFVASFESIFSVGAIPVLVDIDDTLTLDPQAVEKAITPRTKAIMPVHMCGAMADLDALKAIATKHNLYLIEDACQSFGGTYKGKYLGTIGDIGTFSFDFVKTMTCGEGGGIVTHNESWYTQCDAYTDHGHDHLGVDRGADLHPYIGYNFRISELHAAVGLAQLRKVDQIINIQRNTKAIFKKSLQQIPEVSFRRIPDESGDTATFLEIFLPNAAITEKAAAALKAAGIVNFYYYNNNWHYIRNWDHFQNSRSLSRFGAELREAMEIYKTKTFPSSDHYISRCLCMPINLSWTDAEIEDRAQRIQQAIQQAIHHS
jgi:8-amino-3,8-dideoxy-alpha-D-manno-octulosonate transaminase